MDEESSSSKRRRAAGLVTPNACSECRRKRTKCDGTRPCSRCEASGVTCSYEAPVRQSKDSMRNELQQLHTYRQQSELIFRSLADDNTSSDVLQRLRFGEALESIAIRLNTGSESMQLDGHLEIGTDYQSFDPFQAIFGQSSDASMAGYLESGRNISDPKPTRSWGSQYPMKYSLGGEAGSEWDNLHENTESFSIDPSRSNLAWAQDNNILPQADFHTLVGRWGPHDESAPGESLRDKGQELLFGPCSITEPEQRQSFNVASWTSVTDNTDLMDHLLALYFCWEYPTFASISKEHFLLDYRSGSQRFCSPLLVNSLLALGARFSAAEEIRGDFEDGSTAGDAFFAEALRLLKLENSFTLTTVQALGLMSIREASCGRDSDSWFHSDQSIKMACEMGLHRIQAHHEGEAESDLAAVQTATFWGAFALNIAWSLIIGRLPHLSSGIAFMGKPSLDIRVESNEWVPYTDNGMPLELRVNQPSNVRAIYKCFCELSEILHHSLYILYSPGNRFTARRLVAVYTSLLDWYGSLPEALRLGKNFTPAVLFVHMYYHLVIHHLFRPFIKTRLIGSTISPRDLCIQAADNISNLARSYDQLYTLRRTPSLVPYILLTSTLTYLITYTSSTPDKSSTSSNAKFTQGISDLRNMSTCHGFARTALRILRYLSRKWKIEELYHFWSDEDMETKEEREASDGVRFDLESMNYFCPDIKGYSEGLGDINSDYPLFSIFAMQGLPLVARGKGMEEAGFEMVMKRDGKS